MTDTSAKMTTEAPTPGVMEKMEPGIRRILCPNPSPMTYWGTNTFVLGEGAVTLVDPGPDIAGHARAILDELERGERIARILVTHAHLDHSPLARPMAEHANAPVLAFGGPHAGRSEVMERLARAGLTGGGEGIDLGFAPDEILGDGETVDIGNGLAVEALWTPGHHSNHLAFALGDAVLVGDHVMAWASSLVSPPDGDLTAFMESSARLRARGDRVHYPAHGPAITAPADRLDWLIQHRKSREAEILARLATGPADAPTLTRAIYTDTPATLMAAAERNVFAHLIDLENRAIVTATPHLSPQATFTRIA